MDDTRQSIQRTFTVERSELASIPTMRGRVSLSESMVVGRGAVLCIALDFVDMRLNLKRTREIFIPVSGLPALKQAIVELERREQTRAETRAAGDVEP